MLLSSYNTTDGQPGLAATSGQVVKHIHVVICMGTAVARVLLLLLHGSGMLHTTREAV